MIDTTAQTIAQGGGTFKGSYYSPTNTPAPTTAPISSPSLLPAPASQTTATVPVVTAKAAQTDYNNKLANFNSLNAQISQQKSLVAQQAAQKAADDAQKEVQQAEQTLKQQGLDIQKQQANTAQTAANAKLSAVQGLNSPTPNQQNPQNQTQESNQNPQDQTQNGLNQAVDQKLGGLQDIQNTRDQLTQQSNQALQSLLQGTIPLSGPQQALISSLQTQLNQNIAEQTVDNNAYTGTVTEAGFRAGGEYTPQQYAGQIHTAISAGVAKIQALDNTAAKTMADLEQSFQKDNFNIINQQFTNLTKTLDDKANAIKDTYDTVTKAIQDQRDFTQKAQQFAQTQAMEQQKFAEQVKNDQSTRAIAQADLGLKEATWNATYGSFMNKDGTANTSVNPTSIPGYTTLSNGMAVIDGSKLPPGVNKTQIGGIRVIDPAKVGSMTSWSNINTLFNTTQTQNNQLNDPNFTGDRATLKASYIQNINALNATIKDVGVKDPTFSTLNGISLATPGIFNFASPTTQQTQFNTLRDNLNSVMGSIAPGSGVPIFGQTFKSPLEAESWAASHGQTTALNNLKASFPNATAEQLLNALNTGQEPQ